MRLLSLRSLLVVLPLGALAAGGAWSWKVYHGLKRGGLPQRSGEAALPGLRQAVAVHYDRYGVPHLRAAGIHDLAAALGWVHANDRFAQMEMTRRIVAGRLSEVLGPRGVELDRRMRTMRLRRAAQAKWDAAPGETRAWLEAYAAGVNAWLERRRSDLPPFFQLSAVEPEPWTPVDSFCIPMLMAYSLSFFTEPEEDRYQVLRELGEEALQDWAAQEQDIYIPRELFDLPHEPAAGPAGEREAAAPSGGSNNWVVGASRTAGGAPLIANDPHLGLRLPSIWYQAHLSCPELRVAGLGLPGVPGIVIGHNEQLGWGFTNAMLDDHDYFFEILSADGKSVKRGDEWAPIAVERQTIQVKGGKAVDLELRETDRGPLLPEDRVKRLPPRSLAWSGYEAQDELGAFLALARAATLEDARQAAAAFVCPAQNLVVGHRDGGLLYTVFGRVPERRRGDGHLPSPGWDPSYGWNGLRPAAQNPAIVKPPDDLLVTANNDLLPAGYELPYSAWFDTPHRARRIRQLLEEGSGWTAETLAALQSDVVDLYAREIIGLVDGSYSGAAGQALAALQAWDGTSEPLGAAALFWLFEKKLGEAIYGDEHQVHGLPRVSSFLRRGQLLRLLHGQARRDWFDDRRSAAVETREQAIGGALAAAWEEGTRRWGADVSRWRYGEELHRLTLRHALGDLPVLGGWFNRGPYAMPGSVTTVAAFGGSDESWTEVSWGPSHRSVWDAGDWDRSLSILPGGQSEHPADPHYDDQIELYLAGRSKPAWWSDGAVAAATVSTLNLVP